PSFSDEDDLAFEDDLLDEGGYEEDDPDAELSGESWDSFDDEPPAKNDNPTKKEQKGLFTFNNMVIGGGVVLGVLIIFFQMGGGGNPPPPPPVVPQAAPEDASLSVSRQDKKEQPAPVGFLNDPTALAALERPNAAGDKTETLPPMPIPVTGEGTSFVPDDMWNTPPRPPPVESAPIEAPPAPAPVSIPPASLSVGSKADENRTVAALDRLNERLDSFSERLDRIETRLDEAGTAGTRSSEIESMMKSLRTLEDKVAALSSRKNEASPPAPQGKTATVKTEPAKSAAPATAPRPPKKQATAPPTPQIQWVLKAASSGNAYVARAGSNDITRVRPGDSLPGIGKINGIYVENGLWVVQGTDGRIVQR
ncbi:MAG: hypothetical protein KDJ15_04335, partial [Alphaproteobacteria bacterium]|nr:hypothetical protein [Alphaproteobacteria bacterium]